MKINLQEEILSKKEDVTKEAISDKEAPTNDPSIVLDREKLERRATYNADIHPYSAQAMSDYHECKKNTDAENIIISTGAYATGKPAFDASSLSGEPTVTAAVTTASALYGAFKALEHVEAHNRECEIKNTLSQPDPVSYSHKLLCENTQKLAELNPFKADCEQTTILPVQLPALPSTLADNPFGNRAPAIINQFLPSGPDVSIPFATTPEEPEIQILGSSSPELLEVAPTPIVEPVAAPKPAPQPSAPVQVGGYAQTNGRKHKIGFRFGF